MQLRTRRENEIADGGFHHAPQAEEVERKTGLLRAEQKPGKARMNGAVKGAEVLRCDGQSSGGERRPRFFLRELRRGPGNEELVVGTLEENPPPTTLRRASAQRPIIECRRRYCFFLMKLMSPLRSMRATLDVGKILRSSPSSRKSSSRSCCEMRFRRNHRQNRRVPFSTIDFRTPLISFAESVGTAAEPGQRSDVGNENTKPPPIEVKNPAVPLMARERDRGQDD